MNGLNPGYRRTWSGRQPLLCLRAVAVRSGTGGRSATNNNANHSSPGSCLLRIERFLIYLTGISTVDTFLLLVPANSSGLERMFERYASGELNPKVA